MNLENKYLVLKRSDMEAALVDEELHQLEEMSRIIAYYRKVVLGKPENKYVVINQDEPYFPAVLKLMEEHEQRSAS